MKKNGFLGFFILAILGYHSAFSQFVQITTPTQPPTNQYVVGGCAV